MKAHGFDGSRAPFAFRRERIGGSSFLTTKKETKKTHPQPHPTKGGEKQIVRK